MINNPLPTRNGTAKCFQSLWSRCLMSMMCAYLGTLALEAESTMSSPRTVRVIVTPTMMWESYGVGDPLGTRRARHRLFFHAWNRAVVHELRPITMNAEFADICRADLPIRGHGSFE